MIFWIKRALCDNNGPEFCSLSVAIATQPSSIVRHPIDHEEIECWVLETPPTLGVRRTA